MYFVNENVLHKCESVLSLLSASFLKKDVCVSQTTDFEVDMLLEHGLFVSRESLVSTFIQPLRT